MMVALLLAELLAYLEVVKETISHYCDMIKLHKWTFLGLSETFVGVDIIDVGNMPSKEKFQDFKDISKPQIFTNMNMVVWIFSSYCTWILLHGVTVIPFHNLLKQDPYAGSNQFRISNRTYCEDHLCQYCTTCVYYASKQTSTPRVWEQWFLKLLTMKMPCRMMKITI